MSSYFWLLLVLVLSFIEITTINLTTIWFVISGVITLVLSFFIDSQIVLFGIFIVGGIILLITSKPLLKKYLNVKAVPTNLDRIIGLVGVVTDDIKDGDVGEIKVDGKRWSAISKEDLLVGEKVIVEKINGVKLVVRKEDILWIFYLFYLLLLFVW